MQVKLIIRHIPFVLVNVNDSEVAPFYFYPHLIHPDYYHHDLLNQLVLSIPRVREFYNNIIVTIRSIPNIKYVVMAYEFVLTDDELQQLIVTAQKLGIKLRWYVEILPSISEQELHELEKLAKTTPPSNLISRVLQRVKQSNKQ